MTEYRHSVTIRISTYDFPPNVADWEVDADGEEWASGTAPDRTAAFDAASHYAMVHLLDPHYPVREEDG